MSPSAFQNKEYGALSGSKLDDKVFLFYFLIHERGQHQFFNYLVCLVIYFNLVVIQLVSSHVQLVFSCSYLQFFCYFLSNYVDFSLNCSLDHYFLSSLHLKHRLVCLMTYSSLFDFHHHSFYFSRLERPLSIDVVLQNHLLQFVPLEFRYCYFYPPQQLPCNFQPTSVVYLVNYSNHRYMSHHLSRNFLVFWIVAQHLLSSDFGDVDRKQLQF